MKELSELPRKKLEQLAKDLQADCRHLNSIIAVYELAISPLESTIRELKQQNNELKTKLENYENNY